MVVDDPDADLVQHPNSVFAPGEEMLAARDLPLEFIGELPLNPEDRCIRFLTPGGG